jgi:hypothetical protein
VVGVSTAAFTVCGHTAWSSAPARWPTPTKGPANRARWHRNATFAQKA